MGALPHTAQWADDSHLPAWLIAEAVDGTEDALDEDSKTHLKSCPACETLLRQAQSGADAAGWIPQIEASPGSDQTPALAKLSSLLVSNLAARQTPPFAQGQVWQLSGWRSSELAVITKVDESGAFVALLTNDPPELTDPYTVQVTLNRTSIGLAAWFSLETFIHTEVFLGQIDDIDCAFVAAGRTAWRTGTPATGELVTGPSALHNSQAVTYREQLQQRVTSLAHVQIIPESADEDDTVPAHVLLGELGVRTAQVREALHVNAAVAGAILSGDRSLSQDDAARLSEALGAEIPASTVDADPGLVAAVAMPRFRALFIELATRKRTNEWDERRLAVERELSLAARSTGPDSKWEKLLDQYLLRELDAAKASAQPGP